VQTLWLLWPRHQHEEKKFQNIDSSGLNNKHVTIVNYATSGISKLKASLNDDARVIIYDHHMFIVQATESMSFPNAFKIKLLSKKKISAKPER
jgi:nanoRNase/pAp phosphatase (c-di-AMP/oligoRNAs hydrolase)